MVLPIELSCSAMNPIWFPEGSSMTYLFACSKPIMRFISSNCLCTTMPEFVRMLAAGCLSLSTPEGSSGMWTGESKLLSSSLVSRKASDKLGFLVGSSWVDVLGCAHCLLGVSDCCGNFERALGLGRRAGCRDRDVAKVAQYPHLAWFDTRGSSFGGAIRVL